MGREFTNSEQIDFRDNIQGYLSRKIHKNVNFTALEGPYITN